MNGIDYGLVNYLLLRDPDILATYSSCLRNIHARPYDRYRKHESSQAPRHRLAQELAVDRFSIFLHVFRRSPLSLLSVSKNGTFWEYQLQTFSLGRSFLGQRLVY